MATEQYQIGYEAGYAEGFEAGAAQPAVQPLSGWQPIETAPEDVSILVFHPDGGVCESANIEGKTRRIWVCLDGTRGWSTYFESEPTHWMPLPTPPAAHGIGAPKE